MSLHIVEYLIAAVFIGLFCYAAVLDIRGFEIPNWISLGVIALFFVWFAAGAHDIHLRGHLIAMAVTFAVTFPFFVLRLFGAADVKLLTALALWAGPSHTVSAIFIVTLCGGAYAAIALIFRAALKWYPALQRKLRIKWARMKIMPYGPPIAIGALYLAPKIFQF